MCLEMRTVLILYCHPVPEIAKVWNLFWYHRPRRVHDWRRLDFSLKVVKASSHIITFLVFHIIELQRVTWKPYLLLKAQDLSSLRSTLLVLILVYVAIAISIMESCQHSVR
jgi:hypothetical protein